MAGYIPPSVRLTEVTRPNTVNLLTSLRIPVIIGKAATYISVTNEAVVRSTTGLVDSLTYSSLGVVSIQSVGSQAGLSDYHAYPYNTSTGYSLVGNNVVWATGTGSNVPTVGSTYYVSYRYTRPAADYKYKEFTDLASLLTDLGDIQNDTQNISLMAYVMMRKNGVSRLGTVQVASPYSDSDFEDAIDLTKYRDIQDLVVLNTNFAVQSYARAHAIERSLPQNQMERIVWTGPSSLLAVGDAQTSNTMIYNAIALKSENVVYVSPTRAKVSYVDATTRLETTAVVNGPFIAGAVAGLRDSYTDPAQPILLKQVQGVELYDEDLEDYFVDPIMNSMAENGILVLNPINLVPEIRDDVTTDTSTVERTELNVVTAKHYTSKIVRTRLKENFIGNKIINRPLYASIVNNYLNQILGLLVSQAIISQVVSTTAVILPATPKTVNITYEYIPIYTNKLISGEFSLTAG